MKTNLVLLLTMLLGGPVACFKSEPEIIAKKQPFSAETRERLMTSKRFVLSSLFERHPAPYKAQVSQDVLCPDRFHPAALQFANEAVKVDGFTLYANGRKAYGVCNGDDIAYRVFDGTIECRSDQTLLDVKIFFSRDTSPAEIEQRIKSLDCEKL